MVKTKDKIKFLNAFFCHTGPLIVEHKYFICPHKEIVLYSSHETLYSPHRK